jgi:hypothetical protein
MVQGAGCMMLGVKQSEATIPRQPSPLGEGWKGVLTKMQVAGD